MGMCSGWALRSLYILGLSSLHYHTRWGHLGHVLILDSAIFFFLEASSWRADTGKVGSICMNSICFYLLGLTMAIGHEMRDGLEREDVEGN